MVSEELIIVQMLISNLLHFFKYYLFIIRDIYLSGVTTMNVPFHCVFSEWQRIVFWHKRALYETSESAHNDTVRYVS
jgi:hypothetical protein